MRLRHKKWTSSVLEENKDIVIPLKGITSKSLESFTDIEIGCGLGGFLKDLVLLNPDKRYLGIEVNINAFASLVKKMKDIKEKDNFSVINAPFERVIPYLKSSSIDNIYINFPDPWIKKRQYQRRLSYPYFLKEYYRILKPGGKIFFRTDNLDLFSASISYFMLTPLFDLTISYPFYSEKVDYLPSTEYERKFREKGVSISLITGIKK